VVGSIKQLEQVHSPQLDNARDLLVYLPPSYDAGDRRYPVIYMHDGQNLFDPATSFAGEWARRPDAGGGQRGRARGHRRRPSPTSGAERSNEYSPFLDPKNGGGKGDVPALHRRDRQAHHRRGLPHAARPRHTGIAGSSMGGLISLYGFFRYRHAFGFAGVMSPALWFADRAVLDWVERQPFAGGRIYIDVGMRKAEDPRTTCCACATSSRRRATATSTTCSAWWIPPATTASAPGPAGCAAS
jgi:predicted alpha/beta superfamily hydrolase